MSEQVIVSRYQCPECFAWLELDGLMDESEWESMTVQQRVNLCLQAGIGGKHGSKSYNQLAKLLDDELVLICDYYCPKCKTHWPAKELLPCTQTPHQLEYKRTHKEEE